MSDITQNLSNPVHTFVYGILFGGIFLVMSLWNHWKTKREFQRYKTHLSDKLELDARTTQEVTKERARLAQENENLRMQVARLNEKPDNKLHRELEVLARAEKHMMINAPGFAPAWEMAKSQAAASLQSEETGQSFPQRMFRRLLGSSATGAGGGSNAADAADAPKAGGAGVTAA
ncbi:MAG: hypothetical protein K1X78_00300 [Verrucomicrobiaceae bacterium]|nr:hypothetical protein [Verrucomicrobiaceae bacterium]